MADHEKERQRLLGVAWADVQQLRTELTAAQAAIQRVRDLHRQHVLTAPDHDPYCEVCSYEDGWPCPTVRALDGDTTEGA
jgi:hypothetical protein